MNELKLNDSWENLVGLFIVNLDRKNDLNFAVIRAAESRPEPYLFFPIVVFEKFLSILFEPSL